MFNLSEEFQKLKTQTLTLSGIALFISITSALPEKIAIIGLDLSGSKDTAGWFLLAILGYFLLKFIVLSVLEVAKKLLPNWVNYRGKKLRGGVLGFSQSDINDEYERQDQSHEQENIGTLSGEAADISYKRQKLESSCKSKFIFVYNGWICLSDIIFPIIFGCYSSWALFHLLKHGIPHTLT